MRTIISKYGLSLQHVTKGFEIDGVRRTILSDVNYLFCPKKSYAIVGASGSGKSTLLHILASFEEVDQGKVLWDGRAVDDFNKIERDCWISKHIGFVFQSHYLISELSVYDNVRVSALLSDGDVSHGYIEELLAALGLGLHMQHYPHQLSGGQQQRAALARALIKKPTFLIADEPTGSLDVHTGAEIINFCLSHQKQHGMGLIIATHDPSVYTKMDIIMRLADGILSV